MKSRESTLEQIHALMREVVDDHGCRLVTLVATFNDRTQHEHTESSGGAGDQKVSS